MTTFLNSPPGLQPPVRTTTFGICGLVGFRCCRRAARRWRPRRCGSWRDRRGLLPILVSLIPSCYPYIVGERTYRHVHQSGRRCQGAAEAKPDGTPGTEDQDDGSQQETKRRLRRFQNVKGVDQIETPEATTRTRRWLKPVPRRDRLLRDSPHTETL